LSGAADLHAGIGYGKFSARQVLARVAPDYASGDVTPQSDTDDVRDKPGMLTLVKDSWLVCQDCGRKYPIRDDIPVMLIDEGTKWMNTAEADLPVPPPGE
jgi:uncharacterized protein YbaR (Trm112 family)